MFFLYFTIAFISGVLFWDNLLYSFLLIIPLIKIKKKYVVIFLFLAGFLQGLYFYYPYIKLGRFINKKRVLIYGKIVEVKGSSIILDAERVETVSRKVVLNKRVKIKVFFFKKSLRKILKKGEIVKICTKIEIPMHLNPGTFNFANYYKSKGIKFLAFLHNKKDIFYIKKGKIRINFVQKYRKMVEHFILKAHINNNIKSMIIALTTGNKSYMEEKTKRLLIYNGISHLFSISGLHVGIFFLCFIILFRIIFFKINNYYLPFLLSMPFIVFYILFTGAHYPAIRAGLIIVALVLTIFIKRYKEPYRILFFILFLIVAFSPFSFYNLSLQFSFIVVFALIFYMQNKTYDNRLLEFFSVIIIAFFSGIPLSIYHFSAIYPKALIANIFAVPFFTILIIPISVFLIFFCMVPMLNKLLLTILSYFLIFFEKILICLPEISRIFIHSPDFFELICWYMIIFLIIFIIARGKELDFKKFLKIAILILIISLLSFFERYKTINSRIAGVIDNRGHYTVFIKDKFNYLLYSNPKINNFRYKVLPVLLKFGIDKIDYMVIPANIRGELIKIDNLSRLLAIKNIIANDSRVCKYLLNGQKCYGVKERDKVGNMDVLFPPNDRYYLLSFKNSSLMLRLRKISFCYYLTKDIYEYLHYKKISFGNMLITYRSNVNKIMVKQVNIFKKRRGFFKVSLQNLSLENFVESENRYSLIHLIIKHYENNSSY